MSGRDAPCPPRPFVDEEYAVCILASDASRDGDPLGTDAAKSGEAAFICRSCWDAMLDGKARREEWHV